MGLIELAVAGLFGVAVVAAAAVAIAVAVGRGPRIRFDAGSERLRAVAPRLGAAAGAGLLMLVATGWLVGAVFASVAVAMAPRLFGGRRARVRRVARTEAIAAWAEMLRDTLAGAAGLEETIVATARVAPVAIRTEVRVLAARLEHEPLPPALRAFADDVADPTADLVVSALVLAATNPTRDLGALLGSLARSARAQAAMQLRVEAGRARTRSAVRIVTLFTVGFAAAMVVLNRGYLAPFDTPFGQVVLLLIGACFAAAFVLLDRMATAVEPARVLVRGAAA